MNTFLNKHVSFNRQERVVLTVLLCAFFIGAALTVFSRKTATLAAKKFTYSHLDREFFQKSSVSDSSASRAIPSVNTITEAQLIAVPLIGEVLARRIIEFRATNGPLHGYDDLLAVPGIGEKRLRSLKRYLETEYTK